MLLAILDSQPDLVIFALDREYRYLAFNDNHRATMAQIWNVDITEGQDMLALIRRDDDRNRARQNFDRALSGEAFTLIEAYGDEADGGERRYYRDAYAPIRVNGEVVGLTVFLTDVTEQRRTELELRGIQRDLEDLARRRSVEMLHAQKLESLGVLAGGIAHDFNNILAIIIGAADMASLYVGQPDRQAVEIDRIQRGAQRAAELTNQMLSYAGRAERRPERVSLHALIEEMRELLGASGRAAIDLDLGAGCPDVMADASQIRQVVLNLLTNAADAVGTSGQRICVRTRGDRRPAGLFALVEVEDRGVGMSPETLARIFDPFFTTKFQGRGLGLAAVQGIIAAHGGHLEVRSEVGRGSTFRVWLPAISPVGGAHVADEEDVSAVRPPRHVLVVDDEPEVLQLCETLLQSAGVRVSTASDGTDALHLLQVERSVDVVLLDLTMPGPPPEATIRAMHALDPRLPVVVFSGYDEREVRTRLGEEINGFVRKPFRRAALLAALAEAADPERD
ncbi:MAG: response regulator [Alphaproteobacteria bacterium]|nr:response regulator [Alphaproteobacteria bacterium]